MSTPNRMMASCARSEMRCWKDGFYAKLPPDLEPLPAALETADVSKRAVDLTEKFGGYLGPVLSESDEGRVQEGRIRPGRIIDWAAQFGPRFSGPALALLEHMLFIGRDEMNRALRHFLDTRPEFRGSSIVPLGEPKDGSAVMAYYAGDAAKAYDCEVVSLAHAVHRKDAPIIFVDDFIGRGSSAISIVLKLLGEEPIIDLHEARSLTLAETERDGFKSMRKAFVFTAAMDEGILALSNSLSNHGVEGDVFADLKQRDIPTIFTALLGFLRARRAASLH